MPLDSLCQIFEVDRKAGHKEQTHQIHNDRWYAENLPYYPNILRQMSNFVISCTEPTKVVPLTCHGHSRPVTHLSFSAVLDDDQYYVISACKGKSNLLAARACVNFLQITILCSEMELLETGPFHVLLSSLSISLTCIPG